MKTLLLFLTLSAGAYAQTPIISHKCHAGTATTYFIDPNSNFGAIMTNEEFQERKIRRELEVNEVFIDTLQVNDSVRYINYRNKNQDILRRDMETIPPSVKNTKTVEQQQKINFKKQSKQPRQKHSYLLFLFSITFGGVFVTRLFVKN